MNTQHNDDALDEILAAIMPLPGDVATAQDTLIYYPELKKAKTAIQALRRQWELESRIDELQKLEDIMDDDSSEYHWPTNDGEYYDVNKYIGFRYAELKREEADD